jgi:hypothetical protein
MFDIKSINRINSNDNIMLFIFYLPFMIQYYQYYQYLTSFPIFNLIIIISFFLYYFPLEYMTSNYIFRKLEKTQISASFKLAITTYIS